MQSLSSKVFDSNTVAFQVRNFNVGQLQTRCFKGAYQSAKAFPQRDHLEFSSIGLLDEKPAHQPIQYRHACSRTGGVTV